MNAQSYYFDNYFNHEFLSKNIFFRIASICTQQIFALNEIIFESSLPEMRLIKDKTKQTCEVPVTNTIY